MNYCILYPHLKEVSCVTVGYWQPEDKLTSWRSNFQYIYHHCNANFYVFIFSTDCCKPTYFHEYLFSYFVHERKFCDKIFLRVSYFLLTGQPVTWNFPGWPGKIILSPEAQNDFSVCNWQMNAKWLPLLAVLSLYFVE